MITFNGKEYSTIIWDWRMTLYDSEKKKLFWWVKKFFKSHKDVRHILVTRVILPEKRLKIIREEGMENAFEKIYLVPRKRDSFLEIFKEIPKEGMLVIGDNIHDEISVAKSMGVDSVHVIDFVNSYIKQRDN